MDYRYDTILLRYGRWALDRTRCEDVATYLVLVKETCAGIAQDITRPTALIESASSSALWSPRLQKDDRAAGSHLFSITSQNRRELSLPQRRREYIMLARRKLPDQYATWNRVWGAPYGRRWPSAGTPLQKLDNFSAVQRIRGPFAFQDNSSTRAYEFPWAYHQVTDLGPSRIVEIGGALSGLQFVLAKDGHEVHNVDPFFDYGSGNYDVDPVAEHASLNRAFGTNVILHKSTLPEADLDGQFSAVICVSTLEHLPPESIEATLSTVKKLMAPGGRVILTLDLFLNLAPFCDRTTNVWGSNSSVAWIEDLLGYEMIAGERAELYGYEEFSTEDILSRLDEFAFNVGYPQMAQLVTFRAS